VYVCARVYVCVCARKDNEYEAGRQVETRVCRDRGWSSVFRAACGIYGASVFSGGGCDKGIDGGERVSARSGVVSKGPVTRTPAHAHVTLAVRTKRLDDECVCVYVCTVGPIYVHLYVCIYIYLL